MGSGEALGLVSGGEALLPKVEARGVARLVQRHGRVEPSVSVEGGSVDVAHTKRVVQAVVSTLEGVAEELPVEREEDGAVFEVEAHADGRVGPEARGVIELALLATAIEGVLAPPERPTAGNSAALEAAGSSSRGRGWASLTWECRAAQSRQARPEEAQGPSFGTARAAI